MSKSENLQTNQSIVNIKSSKILKIVFSFIEEKQKLKIIINNKEIQKLISINIEDYKKLSGRYKIVEKNGKGKEYSLKTNILLPI